MTGFSDRFRRRSDAADAPAASDPASPVVSDAPAAAAPDGASAPSASAGTIAPAAGTPAAAAGTPVPPAGTTVPPPGVDAPTPGEAGTPPADAPTEPAAPAPDEQAGFARRGKLRRRLRYLRRVRELGYRDLGGLVFDQHRFGRADDALVRGKVAALLQIDGELRALEQALHDHRPVAELREAGIAACSRCGAIHGSEARFCPACGLSLTGPTELSTMPVASAAAAGAQTGAAPTGAPTTVTPPPRAPVPRPPSLFQEPAPAPTPPAPVPASSDSAAEQPTTVVRAADVGDRPVSSPVPPFAPAADGPQVTSGDPLAPPTPPADPPAP